MTHDSVYVVLHCYDEAVSGLDDSIVEENLELHLAMGLVDGARIRTGVLHPEGVVIMEDSKTLRANVAVAGGLACRVLFLSVKR